MASTEDRVRKRHVESMGIGVPDLGIARISLLLLIALGTGVRATWAKTSVNSCADITSQASTMMHLTMPVLQYTVTNFDPSWFDMQNPEKGPALFQLTLNVPDSLDNRLRLRMVVEADTSRRGKNPIIALDRVSAPLDKSYFRVPLLSNRVFDFPWEGGGITFEESDLFNVIAEQRQAPEMDLYFRFALTCENIVASAAREKVIEVVPADGGGPGSTPYGRLRYVKTIQAQYPGTQITSPKPVPIYTITPIFKVASELFSKVEFEYPPGEPKIEIFLYELLAGENPADAVEGIEFAKFGLFNESPSAYPSYLPRLEPGRTYAWRARAVLRGPTTDYLYSNPLYFKVDERLEGGSDITMPSSELTEMRTVEQQIKFGDDHAKRVLAALKIILGENFEVFDLSRAGKIPAKGQIRLNGHPYSLEELERLAREFHQSKHSLTRLRFQ